jgi:hypothetical protein
VIICTFVVLEEIHINETEKKKTQGDLCPEKCTFLKLILIQTGRAGVVPVLH